jgi:hypothetical protein
MARPRKLRAVKQSAIVVMKMTPSDKKKLDAAAARERLPVATLARLYVMRAVDGHQNV